MIDFVHLFKRIENYKEYLERTDIKFVEGIEYLRKEPIKYFWNNNLENGCKIKVGYNNWLDFTGSITKFWYDENYNNLPYSDLCCAIYELADTLKSRPNELILRSFEFGLNIPMILDFKALELTEFALNYKNKFFEDMDNYSKNPSIGKRCKLQEYQLKLYSKSMQYNLPNELLRYEIKVHKMNCVKKYNIERLGDFENKDKLIFLKNELIEKLNKILFYDNSIPIYALKSNEQLLCLNWQSPIYRKNLVKSNPKKFSYERSKLIDIINEFGKNNITETLIYQISNTWNELLES